jgi:hypothetical protein
MTDTAAKTTWSSQALMSFGFQDASVDLMMVMLSVPLPARNNSRDVASALPPASGSVRCFAFDAGGVLHSQLFAIDDAFLATTNMSTTGRLYLADPRLQLQPADRGAPCIADSNDIGGTPLVGVVSSTGTTVGVVAMPNIAPWIADMFQLRYARWLDPTVVSLSNRNSHLLLDVAWASVKPNEPVNQIANNTQLNQEWYRYTWPNVTNAVSFVSAWSGKCLEAGPTNFLRQNSCTGASNQLWRSEAVNGGVRLHPRSNDAWCIDVPSSSTSQGQPVQIYPCNTGLNQVWDVLVR